MKDWLINIIFFSVFSAVLIFVLPKNKMTNIVKSILSIVVLILLIKPVYSVKNDEIILQTSIIDLNSDSEFLSYLSDIKSEIVSKEVLSVLSKKGLKGCVVEVFCSDGVKGEIKVEKIDIKLKNQVIIFDDKHIDIIDDVINTISNSVNIDKDKIYIYV